MAKETLDKILEIEDRAAKIIKNAEHESSHLIRQIKEKNIASESDSAEKMKKKKEALLNKNTLEAKSEVETINKQLLKDIKNLKEKSRTKLTKAKDIIFQEIRKKLCL